MARELSEDDIIDYVRNNYLPDEQDSEISFYKAGKILETYMTLYKENIFKGMYEYVLLHKYYKDFLEEVMPIITTVNSIYANGSITFNQDLYQKADLANKVNKQIIERVLSLTDLYAMNKINNDACKEIFNLIGIKNNNIFNKNLSYDYKPLSTVPDLDYSKEYTDPIRNYFIIKENVTKKELLTKVTLDDIIFFENLLNVIYAYKTCEKKMIMKKN